MRELIASAVYFVACALLAAACSLSKKVRARHNWNILAAAEKVNAEVRALIADAMEPVVDDSPPVVISPLGSDDWSDYAVEIGAPIYVDDGGKA